MQYLDTYLNQIIDNGNEQLAESIRRTADQVGNNHIKQFSFASNEIGLLFGNVQSGKTSQMFGILCKAADLGFSAFVLLTTDNNLLQQQTLDRVKKDLEGFCICGENDSGIFIQNALKEPVIVVLKKNARILKLWANVFNSTGFMKGNPLFIIDDEGDAASLNTLINKDQQSTINKHLDTIRNGASSSMYLQVTGTPQSILLQTLTSGWHPLFTYYFQPGDGYLGGDFFFPQSGKPDCVTFLNCLKDPVKDMVLRHLIVSSQSILSGDSVCNCLVHPSSRVAEHQSCANEIKQELYWCLDNLDCSFVEKLHQIYSTLNPKNSTLKPFPDILNCAQRIVKNDQAKIIIMNAKHDTDCSMYTSGVNFIIGGNTLGRGVTFPRLQTIYYTRLAKKPQADTMWQHSRMFGYDRDPGMMMVFIDSVLYKIFADINATNNSITSQIEKGIDTVKISYSKGLLPTRKAVLDLDHLATISGGTNYFPLNPDNDTFDELTHLLHKFDDTEPYYQVSLRLIKEILNHITSSPDFKLNSFQAALDAMLADTPTEQGILIVRRDRDVAQGTGALLSPNDWSLGGSFTSNVVLTIYQVTGNKGWGGKPLWVPNVKLPLGMVYYDILD